MIEIKTERTLISFKDMVMAYGLGGLKDVLEHAEKGNVSKSVHRQAIKVLKDKNKNPADYEEWYKKTYPFSPSTGRTPPIDGEVRLYSAQQAKKAGPFLRLPLDLLGVEKQSKIKVTFDKNEIRVSAANEADLKQFMEQIDED